MDPEAGRALEGLTKRRSLLLSSKTSRYDFLKFILIKGICFEPGLIFFFFFFFF